MRRLRTELITRDSRGSPWHRISAARTLAGLKQYDEARKTAQSPLEMATTEQARAAAQASAQPA